jgi:hypothetical protein
LIVLAAPLVGQLVASASRRAQVAAMLLLALQMAMLFQRPSYHAPSTTTAHAFSELTASLQRCAAEVGGESAIALDYTRLTGEPYAHTMALSDLHLAGDSEVLASAVRALSADLDSSHGPHAIAVSSVLPALRTRLERNYRECARVLAPVPATGYLPGVHDPELGKRVLRVLVKRPR